MQHRGGRLKDALIGWERLEILIPGEPKLGYFKTFTLARMGRTAEAFDALAKAIDAQWEKRGTVAWKWI